MADQKTPVEPPPAYTDPPPKRNGTSPAPARRPPPPLELPALNMIRGKRIGLTDLEIIPSTLPEDQDKGLGPFEYVLATAEMKARNIYTAEIDSPKGEPALVLAADTVVSTHMGQILEKPRSEREHFATLQMLRDQNNGWHKVYTAVVAMAPLESAVDPGYAVETHVEETSVKFDQNVTDELLMSYVRTREGADKAGGYGIQGTGSILVEKIDGTFDNVVGLPLRATLQLIEKVIVEPEEMETVDAAL